MPFIPTQQKHFPHHQHGSQNFFFIYTRGKKKSFICLAELQTGRMFKREKNLFVLIDEKSQVIQIPPLGWF